MRKTSIMLAAFTTLQRLKMVKAAVVFAPLRVCYTSWPSEVAKWKDFNHLSIGIVHGPKKAQVLREKHDLYLINYEGIDWLIDQLSTMKKLPFDMLIADESTRLKHTTTNRFKRLKPWLRKFSRRCILTGSASANGLRNLFGQCFVMDSGETLGPYKTRFENEFFDKTGYGGYTLVPKPGAREAIYARLAPRVFYAHDEDYLDLPLLLEKDIEVELPPKAMAIYKQMEHTLRLEFSKGRVNAANAAVASMKCRQIANGGVYLDTHPRTWEHVHEAKTEAVIDLIDELSGQPALITYDFEHDRERLQRALKRQLGEEVPYLGNGGLKASRLPGLIQAWNRLEVPAIIVSPASAALGVDGLQEAGRAVIWHSLTYDYELYDQLIRRLRRSGQTERVLLAHIIAKRTVDHAILRAVSSKEGEQTALFMALKAYWAETE